MAVVYRRAALSGYLSQITRAGEVNGYIVEDLVQRDFTDIAPFGRPETG